MTIKPTSFKKPVLIFYVGRDSYFLSHRLPTARAAMAEGYEVHVIAGDSGLGDAIKGEGVTFHPRWLQEDKIPAFSLLLGLIQMLMVGMKCRARAYSGRGIAICIGWIDHIYFDAMDAVYFFDQRPWISFFKRKTETPSSLCASRDFVILHNYCNVTED